LHVFTYEAPLAPLVMQGRTNIDPLSVSESISCLTVSTVDAVVHGHKASGTQNLLRPANHSLFKLLHEK